MAGRINVYDKGKTRSSILLIGTKIGKISQLTLDNLPKRDKCAPKQYEVYDYLVTRGKDPERVEMIENILCVLDEAIQIAHDLKINFSGAVLSWFITVGDDLTYDGKGEKKRDDNSEKKREGRPGGSSSRDEVPPGGSPAATERKNMVRKTDMPSDICNQASTALETGFGNDNTKRNPLKQSVIQFATTARGMEEPRRKDYRLLFCPQFFYETKTERACEEGIKRRKVDKYPSSCLKEALDEFRTNGYVHEEQSQWDVFKDHMFWHLKRVIEAFVQSNGLGRIWGARGPRSLVLDLTKSVGDLCHYFGSSLSIGGDISDYHIPREMMEEVATHLALVGISCIRILSMLEKRNSSGDPYYGDV